MKSMDKKRHRDGPSSRGHDSNKLKNSAACLSSGVMPTSQGGSSSAARGAMNAGGSGDFLKNGLLRCKTYAEKVAGELSKMLVLDEAIDVGKVSKLRKEAHVLKDEKLNLEKKLEDLTKNNNASTDRIYSLLTEKSDVLNECGSLNVKVANLENEVRGL
ncbi:uncharacterized protein LOC141683176 [Apium graveolens]|uniref:uncharacterized protein LOC141683176 n=1 Tax=Apium graveolens TaxID=4045 RepID=UPI003D7AF9EF